MLLPAHQAKQELFCAKWTHRSMSKQVTTLGRPASRCHISWPRLSIRSGKGFLLIQELFVPSCRSFRTHRKTFQERMDNGLVICFWFEFDSRIHDMGSKSKTLCFFVLVWQGMSTSDLKVACVLFLHGNKLFRMLQLP
jgi:hypothetical protein